MLAQGDLTGGGVGLSVPGFPEPFDTPAGLLPPGCGRHRGRHHVVRLEHRAPHPWGRALVAIRDNPVAAESVGVPVFRMKLVVFVASGVTAGVAGALFASLQSYITPDTFVFELGLFFFVCIIIGGRGSIAGPLVGTAILTALPELVAPLAKLGTLFYGLLLLAVVLLVPEGIGRLFEIVLERLRPRQREASPVLEPHAGRLASAIRRQRD
jgi:branched-chain amino acid transport system permease protein